MARGNTDAERQLIRHAIEHGEVDRLPEIIAIVRRPVRWRPRGRPRAMRPTARAPSALPDSAAREALLELCARSVHRDSS
jgi:octaprenyl-diphosphate synthase